MNAPERIWAYNELRNGYTFTAFGPQPHFGPVEYVRADLFADLEAEKAKAEAERDEARRRRDEWKKKAEGFDAVCTALREKVGAPWPPHLSRVMWAGLAAAEKARADRAEALLKEAVEVVTAMRGSLAKITPMSIKDRNRISDAIEMADTTLAKIKEAQTNG
jgi:hypothetical protein